MEGLGGAECRLRRGGAALAFCILLPGVPEDIVAWPLLGIDLIPVVSAGHPLAHLGRPATRTDLGEHVQLVLSDPSAPDGPTYRIVSTKAWRFVELGRRLDFVIAGLGWCRMPEQLVTPLLVERRFVRLAVEDDPSPPALWRSTPHTCATALLVERRLASQRPSGTTFLNWKVTANAASFVATQRFWAGPSPSSVGPRRHRKPELDIRRGR